MPTYYDDNFGHWEINDQEDVEYYHHVQETNVRKKCQGCGKMVNIQPQYAYCNTCTDKIERGMDFECG